MTTTQTTYADLAALPQRVATAQIVAAVSKAAAPAIREWYYALGLTF